MLMLDVEGVTVMAGIVCARPVTVTEAEPVDGL